MRVAVRELWNTFKIVIIALLLIPCAAAYLGQGSATWHRLSDSPVLSPEGTGWESAGTFNPTAIRRDGKIILLYRAQDTSGTSRLGYAESADGIHFVRRAE